MRTRQKNKLLQNIAASLGMLILFAVLILSLSEYDEWKYRRFADTYEACVSSDTCTPTAQQAWVYERNQFRIIQARH
jgi:hypothetical protein